MDAQRNPQQHALFVIALKVMTGAGAAFVALLPLLAR